MTKHKAVTLAGAPATADEIAASNAARAKPKRAAKTKAPAAKAKEAATVAPTIGRIVHYYDHSLPPGGHAGGAHGPYAAIVSGLPDSVSAVMLQVMPPVMPVFSTGPVLYREEPADAEPHAHEPAGAYWTWPPR